MAWVDRLGMRKGQEWWRVWWTVLEPGGHFVFPAGLASLAPPQAQTFRSSGHRQHPKHQVQ